MLVEKIYHWIRRKFCKHRFRKHYDVANRKYICRCVNAEKQNSTTEHKHVAMRVIFMPCHMAKNWTYPAGGLTGYIPYR